MSINHNVLLVWIFTLLDSVSTGIYSSTVLSGFLYHITNGSNARVGLAEGLQGISQAALAAPAGLSINWYGTANVLKASGLGAVLTLGLLVAVLFIHESYVKSNIYWFLTGGIMLLGALQSFWFTSVITIYADSVPRIERTWYNNNRRMLLLAGRTVGPVLAIVMFSIAGDTWTYSELRWVLAMGIAIRCLGCILLLFFNDSKTLGEESAAVVANHTTTIKYAHLVPYIIIISDFIKAFASGMTIKFFPLFFKNEVNMTPIQVNAIRAVTFFLLIFSTYLSGKVSNRLGRIQTLLMYAFSGTSLLALMGALKSRWTDWRVIVPIYVFRTILMNSCSGIRKSVLMDFVPKKSRGKWNAVDGVTRFSWSGSAFVGGILIDKYGYGYTFLLTAGLQATGYSILISLLFIIPSDKKPKDDLAQAILTAEDSIQGKITSQPIHSAGHGRR